MNKVVQWMIASTAFKKWNGILGGFCLGLWVSANYWREIKGTLAVWGIDKDTWMNSLVVIIGASGVLVSMGLSEAKKRKEIKKTVDTSSNPV